MGYIKIVPPYSADVLDANGKLSQPYQNLLNQMLSLMVQGPASATDNATVKFDGTTGKLIK